MTENGPIEVYLARDRTDAQMVFDFLVARGIRARIVGGDLRETAGGDVGLGALSAPAIWAPAEQAAAAGDLVREYESEMKATRDNPPEEWQCPSCGETVDGGFDLCWNCQAERAE